MNPTMAEVMEVINRYVPKGFVPKVGIILGSGMSSLAEQIVNPVSIPYQAIPGLQSGSVSGHASLMATGLLNDVPVVCMRGRLHLYEGIPYQSIRTLVQIVRRLGASSILLTCAVGSLNPAVVPGDLMVINDHINFHPGNPLVGPNDESVGPRFVSMDDAYDPTLRELMFKSANRIGLDLKTGVYISTLGPSFETPAEIRAFRMWGADAVGMSVVPEVIAARHCGLKVACLAAITNLAAGLSNEKITHEGTLQYGEIVARKMAKLIPEYVKEVNNAMV